MGRRGQILGIASIAACVLVLFGHRTTREGANFYMTPGDIVKTVDGDTVRVAMNWLAPPLGPLVSVRIDGVDTPELSRPKCDEEREAAEAARNFVADAITDSARVYLRECKRGKYAGRMVCSISLDGIDLASLLVEAGHARFYSGDEPRASWCP